MIYGLLILALALLAIGPQLWVRHVLKKHSKERPNMPGTGRELAEHLLAEYNFSEVEVVEGGRDEDFYDPENNRVSLSPEVYHGKSLTAVAVAAHEVGHALQFNRQEPVSKLRAQYLGKALLIQKLGSILLITMPFVGLLLRLPHITVITVVIGILTMLAAVAMYAAILPEEYDASFNKALPILASGYVPEQYLPAVRQVLKACALTYVAAALADVLNLWRWIAILR